MKVIEYFNRKGNNGVSRVECLLFGIVYPPHRGWLTEIANNQLPDNFDELLKTTKKEIKLKFKERKKEFNTYEDKNHYIFTERRILLKRNGYSSYKEYLQSAEWLFIKSEIRKREGVKWNWCNLCGSGGPLDIHHKSYDIIGSKNPNTYVQMLCRTCHGDVHKFSKDNNVNFIISFIKLKRIRKNKGLPLWNFELGFVKKNVKVSEPVEDFLA